MLVALQKLTEELSIHRILNVKNDHYKVQYRNTEGQNVLTIGKKEFVHTEHQTKFKESWVSLHCRSLWILLLLIAISIPTVATIRLWTEAIEGDFSGVSNYIPAIISVRRRTVAAKRLHAHTLPGLVRSHIDESGCQKSHNRHYILVIQLQYDWRRHLYGWSQGNVSHKFEYICMWISHVYECENHILRSDLNFN